MAGTRRTPFVSTNLTVPARDRLQRLTLNASAQAGKRLSMSLVLIAALDVVERHAEELAAALALTGVAPEGDGSGD